MARIAQYLETPQYLRKALIPMHPDLRLAGLLPPLDAPHHMRATEWKPYREGLVLKAQLGVGSYVDIGLDRMAFVHEQLPANTRATLHVGDSPQVQFMQDFGENMIVGKVKHSAIHITIQTSSLCVKTVTSMSCIQFGLPNIKCPSCGMIVRELRHNSACSPARSLQCM